VDLGFLVLVLDLSAVLALADAGETPLLAVAGRLVVPQR